MSRIIGAHHFFIKPMLRHLGNHDYLAWFKSKKYVDLIMKGVPDEKAKNNRGVPWWTHIHGESFESKQTSNDKCRPQKSG